MISLAIESSTLSDNPAQFDSKEGGTAPALVIDNTPPANPTGSLSAGPVTSSGTNETVVVTYSGPAAINTNTIVANNLSVSGGASIGSVSHIDASNPNNVLATYTINPPNGSSWTASDNGNYTVTLKPNQVEDANNNFAPTANTVFNVAVPDTTSPVVASISQPTVTAANSSNLVVTVVYTDNVLVMQNTIGTGDISINGPGGSRNATSVGTSTGSNAATITATYQIAAPAGGWSASQNGSYNISIAAGAVTDTSANGNAVAGTTYSVSISDSTAPAVASITAPTVTGANSNNLAVTVVYSDDVAVMQNTIGVGDISVDGPGGSRNAASFTTSTGSNAATITATYQIAAPAGGWSATQNGTYNISIAAGSVTDTSSHGIAAAGTTFGVHVADSTAPIASNVSAQNISVVGGDTQTITVVYTDDVAVRAGTIGLNDISISGGPAALTVSSFSTSTASDSSLITATYTVTKTNSQAWAFADNGTYTINVAAGAITDTNNNPNIAKTGSFTVTLPAPDTTLPTHTFVSVPNVTAPGGTTETITVVYSDNNAINPATVDSNSLSVSGAGNTLSLLNLSKFPSPDGKSLTAVYTFNAPGGAWTENANGNYTVTIPPNHVTDTSGNADIGGSTTFNVNATIPDLTPPQVAAFNAANISAPGAASEEITVIYTDNAAVDTNSITTANVTVGGARTLHVSAASFSATGSAPFKTVTATYTVDAPGGAWAASANGAYTVTLGANQVKDTSGNFAASTATSFTVNATIPDTTPPAVTIIAPGFTSASLADQKIVVIFTDAGSVKASSIATSNLTVSGPSGALTVARVEKTPAGNSQTVTAVYTVTPLNGGWSYASKGTYQVSLAAGSVKDTSGNGIAATSTSFDVNIPTPADPNDPIFNHGSPVTAPFTAEASAVLSNGQLVVVGEQGSAAAGKSQGVIELFNADGTVAAGFGTNGLVATPASANETFHAVLAQGTKFIVAGSGGGFLLQRYNTSGQLDPTFGTAGTVVTNFGAPNEAVYALALNPNGTIAAGGTSNGNFTFAEYDAKGNLVTTFGQKVSSGRSGLQEFDLGSTTDVVGSLAFQSNGDLIAVGSSASQVVIVRLTPSGDADTTFGSSGLVIVPGLAANISQPAGDHTEGLAIEPDNSILVANQTALNNGHFGVVHLDANGNLIPTFGTNGLATAAFGANDDADAVYVQPGGQIVVAGTTDASGTPTALAAFDQTGAPIASFGLLGKLLLPAAVGVSSQLVSGSNITSAFGTQTSDGHLVLGTNGISSSSIIRKLSVAGTKNANAGTPLGSFGPPTRGHSGRLTVGINGAKVTLSIVGGSGQAFLAANGLHLVIAAGARGATLTITVRGGSRRVTLGDLTVTGSLNILNNKSVDLAGTISASGSIGTLSIGNVRGGTIAAGKNINSVSLISASDAHVLAGANLGTDGELGGQASDSDTFSSAVLRTFKVTGSLTNSVIAAGVDPVDGIFLDSDDKLIGGSIRTISVRKIDGSSRFESGKFGTANIPKKVKPTTDNHFKIL